MLELTIGSYQYFDKKKEETMFVPSQTLRLEHSLVAISKWESFYEKPFLTNDPKTEDEIIFYTKCMTLDEDVPDRVYNRLSAEDMYQISQYIAKKHTATWFSEVESRGGTNSDIITSEVIYYWMVTLNIPFECETWNLNRLITLVRVINAKNQPQKMSRSEAVARAREINRQRRAELNTRG